MKYQQPFGTAADSPYINGNPATGTQGSIPPAESIEHPQREIVDLITKEGLAPSSLDLGQLAKGVQLGKINYAIDTGSSNALEVSLVPILGAYQAGLPVKVRKMSAANTSTGPTLNCNGLGPKLIVRRNGGPLEAGSLPADAILEFVYDGVNFRLLGVGAADLATVDAGNDNDSYVTSYNLFARRVPYFSIGHSYNQNVAPNVWTTIANSTRVDGFYFRDPASSCLNSRFTCGPKDAGLWLFNGTVGEQVLNPATNPICIVWYQFAVNGEFIWGITANSRPHVVGMSMAFMYRLSAGNIVTHNIFQDSGVYHYVGNSEFSGFRIGA